MFAVAALALLSCASCSADQSNLDERAQDVVQRSQRTTASYSLFTWNDVTTPSQIPDGWAAEFHRGSLHRVETPRDRLVANCAAMTGTYLSVETGEKQTGPQVAKAACGINANKPFRSAEWLGRHKTAHGEADRVRLTDDDNIRTYDVLDNGALVSATFADSDGNTQLLNWAVALLDSVPEDIFSEASLDSSVVPEQFKSPPTTNQK